MANHSTGAVNYSKLAYSNLVQIRGLVLQDTVALEKWLLVVDDIVTQAVDVFQIKRYFRSIEVDFGEGVLRTLVLWQGYGDKRANLLEVLHGHGLTALAENILHQVIRPTQNALTAKTMEGNEDTGGPFDQPYKVHGFNEATIAIIVEGILQGYSWSLDIDGLEYYNIVLVNLAREFDFSEILAHVRYKNARSVFNTVGQWAVLAKMAQNASNDEISGAVNRAGWQWRAIEAVLNHALERGIEYCCLVRGWDGQSQTGTAQGDQILKILSQNPGPNNVVKTRIFELIGAEAKKGAGGLYEIPSHYRNNGNVQVSAEKHKKFVQEELETVTANFYAQVRSERVDSQMREITLNDFRAPPGTGGGNLMNPANLPILLAQAQELAGNITTRPNGLVEFFNAVFALSTEAREFKKENNLDLD